MCECIWAQKLVQVCSEDVFGHGLQQQQTCGLGRQGQASDRWTSANMMIQ